MKSAVKTLTQVVCVIFVVVTFSGVTDACSCMPSSNRLKGCSADFIFKTRVKSGLKNPNNKQDFDDFYRIRRPWARHIYKFISKSLLSKRMLRRLYTATNGALCGVTYLTPGKLYLITGKVNSNLGRMEIDLCNSWIKSLPLQKEDRQLLKTFRNNSTRCDVSSTTLPPITLDPTTPPPKIPAITTEKYTFNHTYSGTEKN